MVAKEHNKSIKGTVVSNAMDKSVVVEVSRVKTHPLYRKKYVVHSKFKAHDEKNEYQVGDVVEIEPVKPISKDKFFKVSNKVK